MIDATKSGTGIINTDNGSFRVGDLVQYRSRPEYGDSVRIDAIKIDGRIVGTKLTQIMFVPAEYICPRDCGHVVPGNPMHCK